MKWNEVTMLHCEAWLICARGADVCRRMYTMVTLQHSGYCLQSLWCSHQWLWHMFRMWDDVGMQCPDYNGRPKLMTHPPLLAWVRVTHGPRLDTDTEVLLLPLPHNPAHLTCVWRAWRTHNYCCAPSRARDKNLHSDKNVAQFGILVLPQFTIIEVRAIYK